jgi:lipoprotein-anchoring transpeptidase ErfK/SrfK
LAPGYVWVRVTGSTVVNEQKYYRIKDGAYIAASALSFINPSTLAGVLAPTEFPSGWILAATRVSASAGAKPAQDAPIVARYQVVRVYEEQTLDAVKWYRIGENQWIEQKQVGVVRPGVRPAEIPAGNKWIEVNLFEQTLMAYEGDQMVYATLISSGLPRWSTIEGVFRVWAKVRYGTMYGAEGKPDYYYLEDVPWAIYFHDDYAIHAAYWHDHFGYPHSHGCVNVPPLAAQWIFDWADPPLPENRSALYAADASPSTWVWVHD